MSGLLIKDFPEELHQLLRDQAAKNHRSVTKEALYLLEMALQPENARNLTMPVPFQGAFALNDEWLAEAKQEGRA
jgi:plasmid stability protein